MYPSFHHQSPGTIIYGAGKLSKLADCARSYGTRVALVTGGRSFVNSPHFAKISKDFSTHQLEICQLRICDEPSPTIIDECCTELREWQPQLVVGIGGGAVLDAGKAIAAMLCENGSVADYLEQVGSKKPGGQTLPYIAVPTTAGTGSEATANAVITETGAQGYKKSLRHPNYIPSIALVDPELTLSCSPELTAACGMDCFTQLVEGYLSTGATPLTDSLALAGIEAVFSSLERAHRQPDDLVARSGLAFASLLSGIVLANAGLGTVHALAGSLGGRFPLPHGLVCARLMTPCNRATLTALRTGQSEQEQIALQKYARLGQLLHPTAERSATWLQDAFINELERLTQLFSLPLLGSADDSELLAIARQAGNKNNPAKLSVADLAQILSPLFLAGKG